MKNILSSSLDPLFIQLQTWSIQESQQSNAKF